MATRWCVFRLEDSAGACLYVGKTRKTPIGVARSYRTTRTWGPLVDLSRLVKGDTWVERVTEAKADALLSQWVRRYRPLHRLASKPVQGAAAAARGPAPVFRVYLLRDAAGALLYVGSTMLHRPSAQLARHPFAAAVASIEWVECATQETMCAVELSLAQALAPRYGGPMPDAAPVRPRTVKPARPPKAKPVRELSLVERVRDAQDRHRAAAQ